MQLSEQAKKNILQAFIDHVKIISDEQYHKKAWIKGDYGIGFDDLCCNISDLGDPMLENYKDYGLTDNQYQILKNFRDKFEAFSDENSWPPFFIDTPEWAEIMQEAKEVLKAFHYEKSDE